MEDDSIQEFEGHQGKHQPSYCRELIPVPFETFQCRCCETAGCQQLPACPAMHSCVATSESDRGLLLDRQQVRRRTLSTAPACMQL
jgi:hypothetical protein